MDANEWSMSDLAAEEKALVLLFRSNNEEAKELILPLLNGQLPPVSPDLKPDNS